MHKKGIFPYAAIILSVSFWGFSYLSTAACLQYMEPVTLAMLRCIIAAALLLAIWKVKEKNTKVSVKHLPRLIIGGFIGIVCTVVCLYVFGADNLVIPSMILILFVLLVGRKKICR